jgi:hypothetical protein
MGQNNNLFLFGSSSFKPRAIGCLLLLLAMGLLLPACKQRAGSSDKQATVAPAKSDHIGTYNLISINGAKLPCTPPHEGGAPEVQSGAITLKADGSLTTITTFKVPSGQVANREVSGTYTREGSQFMMQWTRAGRTTATLERSTFTMNNEGMMFAYRK